MRSRMAITKDADDMASILRDVLMLARRGSFCVASRRFGDLRLEDGRHQHLERAALELLRSRMTEEDRAGLERLATSRTRLLELEDSCAAALQCCAVTEYEDVARALEGELRTHAALERQVIRRMRDLAARPAQRPAGPAGMGDGQGGEKVAPGTTPAGRTRRAGRPD